MNIAIIGGGLAGCAAAYMLKAAGHVPIIYEAGDTLASGASGNCVGLYNPRFGAEWSPQSQYYASAFKRALSVFPTLKDIEFDPCGALHLITDEKRRVRFGKMVEAWPDDALGDAMGVPNTMRIVSAQHASDIAGIKIDHDALYLPRSGSIHPAKLCAAYAAEVEVRLNARTDNLSEVEADVVVLATGVSSRIFNDTKHIDFRPVRGQVTLLEASDQSEALQCHLCYDGYLSKGVNGKHMVGATFQRWLDHDEVLAQDDVDNLENLYAAIPAFDRDLDVIRSWAGVRCASRDHFPVVGQLRDGAYISSAHGSYGILSSIIAADVLVAMIDNKPQTLSHEVIAALCPSRFKG
ncbi:MAG: FAD-dependent 5-carboxymethylaminomethyl-2-thiouridine(34) oxidoreductase MnmC [Alphaproteobacteria bacterium]|nr:FAD-dependent 5-carboxymethylaminomethyl-2-thiouridine(34) oxidoreductase MnmC [Alphaproteobacteria bacterium]